LELCAFDSFLSFKPNLRSFNLLFLLKFFQVYSLANPFLDATEKKIFCCPTCF
jgi:hypothetical protein